MNPNTAFLLFCFVPLLIHIVATSSNFQRAKLIEEVGEYQELRESISLQKQQQDKGLSGHHVSSKRMVNLGSDVYATAKVQDPKTIYISIGLGFYLQCSLDEGLGLVTERIEILQRYCPWIGCFLFLSVLIRFALRFDSFPLALWWPIGMYTNLPLLLLPFTHFHFLCLFSQEKSEAGPLHLTYQSGH